MSASPDHLKSGICGGCDRLSRGNLLRCSGCKQRMYCNAQCQKKDWPNHKEDCKKMLNNEGKPPVESNPVIAIGRKINQCEGLLQWVDWILIASLDLLNRPKNALIHSVSLVSQMQPTPGSVPQNGRQNMTLRIVCTQVQDSIEPKCVEIVQHQRAQRIANGDDVDNLIWVTYQWHPFPLGNVLFDIRIISARKLDMFKALNPNIPLPYIPYFANAAQKYVEFLNHQLRLPKFAKIATTNVVLSDYQEMGSRSEAAISEVVAREKKNMGANRKGN